jgi:hypothetical protein
VSEGRDFDLYEDDDFASSDDDPDYQPRTAGVPPWMWWASTVLALLL